MQCPICRNPLVKTTIYGIEIDSCSNCIGGGLGGTVNGIRSFLFWHCERIAFGRQFVCKYVTAPRVGATLALFLALVNEPLPF